jgi:general secretion pathway protein G
MKMLRHSARSAFTLLEIMLVVMIIALLASIAIFNMGGLFDTAGDATVKAHLQSLETNLMVYRSKAGFFPTTEQGLKALMERPATEPVPRSWTSLLKAMPRDPWGHEYRYEQPGKHNTDYDLYSPGKDRLPGTADDIGNWEEKK